MSRRRTPRAAGPAPLSIPSVKSPERLAEEGLHSTSILGQLREIRTYLEERRLAEAVCLAQQAQCGHGPLREHFIKLAVEYGYLLNRPVKAQQRRRAFEVVEGGAQ